MKNENDVIQRNIETFNQIVDLLYNYDCSNQPCDKCIFSPTSSFDIGRGEKQAHFDELICIRETLLALFDEINKTFIL